MPQSQLNTRSVAVCFTTARRVSFAVGVVGAVALAGWMLHLELLTNLAPGWVQVKPNTALAFVLAAAALWPLASKESAANPRWLALGRIAAGGVVLIGAFTLVQQVFGLKLGIDGLLAHDGESETRWPDRMSPLAASDFLLLGVAMLATGGPYRPIAIWTAQLFSLIAAFGALIGVTGYLFGQEGLHLVPFFSSTALPTAAMLLALSAAVLCARPEAGMMKLFNAASAGGLVLRRLLWPIALLSLTIDWFELEGERRGIFPTGFNWMLDSTLTTFLAGLLVWIVARLVHEKDVARQQAEETLRTSEDRFSAIFEQAAMGMTVASIDGQFLRVNGKFCAITGYSADEVLGKRFQDITHPDDLESDQRQADRLLQGESPTFTLEKRYVRKDRSLVWVALTASLVRRPNGSPDYFLALIEDISQRRSLETQLRQTQKMDAVGQLAGGVAHDFNNMLTAIQGYGSLIGMAATLPAPARRSLDEIMKAAQRAANLTRQFLIFSRREVMQPCRLNLNESMTQLTKMLQRPIGERVRITLHLHPQSLPIHADSGMIDHAPAPARQRTHVSARR